MPANGFHLGFHMRLLRGFTLIEVMVVMVIIAILVSVVSLSLKGDRAGEALHEEARRLSALLNLAREEAVMRDQDLGLVLASDGYFFVQRNEADGENAEAFIPLVDDAMFRPRTLPAGTQLRFEAQRQSGRAQAPSATASGARVPRVLALSNDMLQPQGMLILSHPATNRVERVLIEADGVRLLADGEQP